MKRFLDYSGLKRFKDDLSKEVKNMIGLTESESALEYASNSDIDNGVFGDEESGNGIIKLKNMSYYHKKLKKDIKTDILTPKNDLNVAVQNVVADALTLKYDSDGDEEKTEIYENVELIVDEKMKWKEEYPQ